MSGDHMSSAPETTAVPETRAQGAADWRRLAAGAALIVLAVFAVYWPALGGQFLWDDFLVVHRNPLVTGEMSLGGIWFRMDFPLTYMAFWLEWLTWGDHPAGYHVVNVLLHVTSALLLWRVLAQLKVRAPWLAAMIFAVHPVCVGSVAWISELKNTLSLPFFLLSILWYSQLDSGLRTSDFGLSHVGLRTSVRYGLSLLAFVLALFSKTSTVMLPVVLLGCAWWQRGRITWRDWLRASPFFALALAFGLMSIRFQAQGAIAGATVQSENFWGRLAGVGMALWFYLGKALLPLNLSMIYPQWKIEAGATMSYLPLVLWGVLLAMCWPFRRTWGRHVLFGLGCFTVLLFPVLGFIDMYFLMLSRVSDHFAYLPLVALVGLTAAGLSCGLRRGHPEQNHRWTQMDTDASDSTSVEGGIARQIPAQGVSDPGLSVSICGWTKLLWPEGRALWCVGSVLVVGLALLGNLRARVFVSEEALWRDTLAKNPTAWCAHANLGWILASQQKYDEAREHLAASLEANPQNASAHSNLGRVLSLQGKFAEADSHFQTALKIKPRDLEIRSSYASALAEQGRVDDAVKQLREVLAQRPGTAARLQLAMLLCQTRKFPEAVAEYRLLLKARPDELEALNNLAWLLATCSEQTVRDGAEAVRLAEHACRLSGYKEARTLGTLAAAYAEAGRFTEAVEAAQKAVESGKGRRRRPTRSHGRPTPRALPRRPSVSRTVSACRVAGKVDKLVHRFVNTTLDTGPAAGGQFGPELGPVDFPFPNRH